MNAILVTIIASSIYSQAVYPNMRDCMYARDFLEYKNPTEVQFVCTYSDKIPELKKSLKEEAEDISGEAHDDSYFEKKSKTK